MCDRSAIAEASSDELWALYQNIRRILTRKLKAQLCDVDQQLHRLGTKRASNTAKNRRPSLPARAKPQTHEARQELDE